MSLKAQPAPVIVKFEGQVTVEPTQAKLTLAWLTKGADKVKITNVEGIQKPFGVKEIRPPLGVSLSSSYTLEASAGDVVTTSTIRIDWAAVDAFDTMLPGTIPQQCAILPNGKRLFCALSSPACVAVLDATSLQQVPGSPLPIDSQCIAASPNSSRVYLGLFDGLAGYDASTLKPIPGSPGRTWGAGLGAAVTPDNSRIYYSAPATMTNVNTVVVFDASNMQQIGTVRVGSNAEGIAFTPDGKRAFAAIPYLSVVDVIDTASLAVVTTIRVASTKSGPGCFDVAVALDGRQLYVTNESSESVSVFDLETYSELPGSPIKLPGQPRWLSPSPDGRLMFVPVYGASPSLCVIDTYTVTLVGWSPTKETPLALAVSPDGFRVFVANKGAGVGPSLLQTFVPTATGGTTMSALEDQAVASPASK
jgi:DNA-binding beta-propeller fold protein YncE